MFSKYVNSTLQLDGMTHAAHSCAVPCRSVYNRSRECDCDIPRLLSGDPSYPAYLHIAVAQSVTIVRRAWCGSASCRSIFG